MPKFIEGPIENDATGPPFLLAPSNFGKELTDLPSSKSAEFEQELAHLKKLLRAQGVARQRAEDDSVEAHRKLKSFEKEANKVRSDLTRAKAQLAGAKEEHTSDLRRAIERETGLWNELAEVRVQATKARDKVSGYKKLGMLCLLILIPVMSWAAVKYLPLSFDGDKSGTKPDSRGITATGRGTASTSPNDFTSDVQRLDQALSTFGNQSAEDVLRKVHDKNAARGIPVCSFEWNKGQMSLLFGEQSGAELGTSVTRCADAVEQAATKQD